MRADLRDLYQAVILEHARSPRNFARLENATTSAHGHNPMCGDEVTVFVRLDEAGRIGEAAFEGNGCAICLASASLMTGLLRGRSPEAAERLSEAFARLCSEDGSEEDAVAAEDREALRQLEALSGVRAFPVRIRCATLPWQTMRAALHDESEVCGE
ncbi:MAG: SUF system NifU family Fe-S cluster assembly protein [Rhodospirillales bacterium]|nr:SUF system NifU family Fe-S cluster assembly protein [Rhodospirillales bacterium]